MTAGIDVARVLSQRWNETAVALPQRVQPPQCMTATVLDRGTGDWRFAFISLASNTNFDLAQATSIPDGRPVDGHEVLTSGDVLIVVWRGSIYKASPKPPDSFLALQQKSRQAVHNARHGLGAVALEELSNSSGATQRSIDALAEIWTDASSLLLDVATEITLGADRQRYVDREYSARFKQRAPGLAERLSQHGIWSNPMLTLP